MHAALAHSTPAARPGAGLLRFPMPAQSGQRPLQPVHAYRKDQEIYAEGDAADCFYELVAGFVRTVALLRDGRRQIEAFHAPGDLFGIECGGEHRFTAEAIGDASVIVHRLSALDSDPALVRRIMDHALQSLRRAQEHAILLGRKSAREKIATFLLDMAARLPGRTVELPMSRTDIGDYLGLTIETVSRTLTQMEREGIIAVPLGRRTIQLRDKAALSRLDA